MEVSVRVLAMTKARRAADPIEALALLEEPHRRRLYNLIMGRRDPLGRDEAAAALGISRELAAFHLDRLLQAGLLEAEYRRLGGRTGPGAGRPAKLYRRSSLEIAISLPARRYDVAADLMARTLEGVDGSAGVSALTVVARRQGVAVGTAARRGAATQADRPHGESDLVGVLRDAGFEPALDSVGTVSLLNCPYDVLAAEHRTLTCSMNLAWTEGVIDGLGGAATARLDPEAGRCCVVIS
jgi:predicted ArsR family transcriptional regulator